LHAAPRPGHENLNLAQIFPDLVTARSSLQNCEAIQPGQNRKGDLPDGTSDFLFIEINPMQSSHVFDLCRECPQRHPGDRQRI
jgi:hypothetical protein